MINRNLVNIMPEAVRSFSVIFITGPRQSGKTTFIKDYFKDYEYVNLEDPAIRNIASSSPTSFVKSFKKNVIFLMKLNMFQTFFLRFRLLLMTQIDKKSLFFLVLKIFYY